MAKNKSRGKTSIKPSKLADIYYDPENPAAYAGVQRLAKASGASVEYVKRWLSGENVYVKHRPVRKRLNNDRIVVSGLDFQHSTDLADMQRYSGENGGIRYLLCVVDSLSKFAWVEPLTDKRSATVAEAMKKIYNNSSRLPKTIRSDRGTEFLGAETQRFFKDKGIIHYTADNRTKASISERFIRTLKEKIFKHFSATGLHRYANVLPALVKGYNHSVHTATGRRPVDVNVYNAEDVWRDLYGDLLRGGSYKKTAPLKIGQKVVIAKEVGLYAKGYLGGWTSERFKVDGVRKGYGGVYRYKLVDELGERILGTFKREELQPVGENKRVVHKIERRREKEGKIPVKYRGYSKLEEWVPYA